MLSIISISCYRYFWSEASNLFWFYDSTNTYAFDLCFADLEMGQNEFLAFVECHHVLHGNLTFRQVLHSVGGQALFAHGQSASCYKMRKGVRFLQKNDISLD